MEIKRLEHEVNKHEERFVSDKTSYESMQEIIETLTQNELANATKFEELNSQLARKEMLLKELQAELFHFNEISNKNEIQNRQLQERLDENNSFPVEVESLDNRLDDDSSRKNRELIKQIENLTNQYEEKVQENKSIQGMMHNNSAKIKKLIQENEGLKFSLECQRDASPSDQIKIKYDKCIKKLRIYREQIYDISEKFKLLKADREVLVGTTKDYSESVSNWQSEIANASMKIIEGISESNRQLRIKNLEIKELEREIMGLKTLNQTMICNESTVKNLEVEIYKLKEIIQTKDKTLDFERDEHKKLKQAVKKTSVLDLEMEAYEKTLDELNRKLETQKLQTVELESTIKMQNVTMNSLKSQISSLEANLDSEKAHSMEVKKNLDIQQNILRKSEHERTEASLQLEQLHKKHETLKLDNDEIKLEMSKQVGQIEKRCEVLESERNEYLKNVLFLEKEVDKFKTLSLNHETNLENLRVEFANYKIRAQSVLRQTKTKNLNEEKLQEELIMVQKTLENFKESNSKLSSELEGLRKNYNIIVDDKILLQNRFKDLMETMEKKSNEVLEESRKRHQQHEESIKTYQHQINTLNAIYKEKVEKSVESNIVITELQAKIKKLEKEAAQVTNLPSFGTFEANIIQMRSEQQKNSMQLIDREEAEGSEDQSSTFHPLTHRKISKGHELMPLDELLNSSFDDNSIEINEETVSNFSSPTDILEQTQSKLENEINRVAHLKMLLADSEKDCARIQQLNEVLKQEVRRQQRNFDREEHIQNSEYLKNVIIKFVSLNNSEEKQRLIPVLHTILKLSSDEINSLQNACKTGWIWSK